MMSIITCCAPATAGLIHRGWRWYHGLPMSITTGHVSKQHDLSATDSSGRTRTGDEEMELHGKESHEDVKTGHGHNPSHSSKTHLVNAEEALAQGEMDGRETAKHPTEGLLGQTMTSESGVTFRGAPDGNSTALVHQTGGEREKVELVHEPPDHPTETVLHYRDAHDRAHKVTLWDVPEGRFTGRSEKSRGGMPSQEVDVLGQGRQGSQGFED